MAYLEACWAEAASLYCQRGIEVHMRQAPHVRIPSVVRGKICTRLSNGWFFTCCNYANISCEDTMVHICIQSHRNPNRERPSCMSEWPSIHGPFARRSCLNGLRLPG